MLPLVALIDLRMRSTSDQPQETSQRAIWFERIVAWLLEPIDFPGKWPADEPPSRTYNRTGENHSLRPRSNRE